MNACGSLVPGHRSPAMAVFRDLAVLRPPVIILSMRRLAAWIPDRHRTLLPVFLALACGVSAGVVFAIDDIELEIDRVSGAGWSAQGIVVEAILPANSTGFSAQIARLRLDAIEEEFRNVRIACASVAISGTTIDCPNARVSGVMPSLGTQEMTGRVRYERDSGDIDLVLRDLKVGEGRAEFAASLRQSGWRVSAELTGADIAPLLQLASDWQSTIPALTATGAVNASLRASGAGETLASADMTIRVAGLTANNESGSLATEGLAFELRGNVARDADAWRFDIRLRSQQGQAYAEPIFVDLTAYPLEVGARGSITGAGVIVAEHFDLDHRDVSRAMGRVTIDLEADQPVRDLDVELQSMQFPGAYASYFQPLLLDTGFKSLVTEGALSGALTIENGAPARATLHFDQLSLDDGQRNFVLRGLNGEVHWQQRDGRSPESPPRDSFVRWDSGTLLNLDLGASELAFNVHDRQVRLLKPARIPIFDGAIELEAFRVRNGGLPSVAFMVDANIQPISVREICKAFGWPEFGGRIGGTISKLRMRDRIVTLGTTLNAQVFDGQVSISDLRLEQPFGSWPRFHSNITLDNLDLDLITSAFSFGGMTGRLSGTIAGLELFNWTPVAFDAKLHTPPGDRSRHRISQRAVENIGSIGGGGAGVTAALSSGFMRFFDEFNYERLGVSCRLEQDVCHMDGVAPAPNGGYYLVKGKGLPRIDVIGSNRRVDWPRLVRQLIAVTQSEGAVVQ